MRTIVSLASLTLLSLSACASEGADSTTEDLDEDHDFGDDDDDVATGCPESLGALGTLAGDATIYSNVIVVSLELPGRDGSFFELHLTRSESHEVTTGSYPIADGATAYTCLGDPDQTNCRAGAAYGDGDRLMLFSATAGTIQIDRVEIEGLGRVAGSFTGFTLEQTDDQGLAYVSDGCQVQVTSASFDVDLAAAPSDMME